MHKLETLIDYLVNDLIDDRQRYLDADGEMWLPLTGSGDGHGANAAWTAERLTEARNLSRNLCDENPFATNGLENRINYVVGTGHQYLVGPRRDARPSDKLLADVDNYLHDFRQINQWHTRQIEHQRRLDRDGEVFIRTWPYDEQLHLRIVEPERIATPTGQETNTNIRLGVETLMFDAETPLYYHLTDDRPIPAEQIQHRKANVDLNSPRGIPLYWPVRRNLRRATLILRNMSTLVEIQSAIALIRKHKGTSIADLQANRTTQAEATVRNNLTGRTDYIRTYEPGTIIDSPAAVEYEFPAAAVGVEPIVAVLKAELRAIAARLVMPEFMFTSDASNAAYASTMVAEGPAVRMFQRIQQTTMHADLALLRKAIDTGIQFGVLPDDTHQLIQLTVEPPNVQVRDFLKQAHADKIAHAAGILSPQTWSQRLNLDYDREQTRRHEHQTTAEPLPIPTPTLRPPDDNGSRFPSDDDPNPTT